jgi:hypothetical protein
MALLPRGDHDMNEVKVGSSWLDASLSLLATLKLKSTSLSCRSQVTWVLAEPAENLVTGGDREAANLNDWVRGANGGLSHDRRRWDDLPEPDLIADIRNVVAADARLTVKVFWPLNGVLRWVIACSTSAPRARPANATFWGITANRT